MTLVHRNRCFDVNCLFCTAVDVGSVLCPFLTVVCCSSVSLLFCFPFWSLSLWLLASTALNVLWVHLLLHFKYQSKPKSLFGIEPSILSIYIHKYCINNIQLKQIRIYWYMGFETSCIQMEKHLPYVYIYIWCKTLSSVSLFSCWTLTTFYVDESPRFHPRSAPVLTTISPPLIQQDSN